MVYVVKYWQRMVKLLLTIFVVSANPTNEQNDVDVRSKGSENEKGPPSEEDEKVSSQESPEQSYTSQPCNDTETSMYDLKPDKTGKEEVFCGYISQSSHSDTDSDQEYSEMDDKTPSVYPSNQQSIPQSTLSTDDLTMDARQCQPPRKTSKKNKKMKGETDNDAVEDIDPKKNKKGNNTPESDPNMDDFIRNLAKKAVKEARPKQIVMFDAAIVYDPRDYDEVIKFRNVVQKLGQAGLRENVRIELFDDEKFTQSQVLVVEDVLNKTSVVLVYLSNKSTSAQFNFFVEEAIGLTRLGINNPDRGSRNYNDKQWVLKPVHTKPLNRRNYKTPIGLTTVNGIEWYDIASSHTQSKVIAMMKSAIQSRKEVEMRANTIRQFAHAKEARKMPIPRTNHTAHDVQSERVPYLRQEAKSHPSIASEDAMSIQEPYHQSNLHTSPLNYSSSQFEQHPGQDHPYMVNERQNFPNNYHFSTSPGMPNHQFLNMPGSSSYMVDQHNPRRNPQEYLAANNPASYQNAKPDPSYQYLQNNQMYDQQYVSAEHNTYQRGGEIRPNDYVGSYPPQYPGSQQRHELSQQSGMHQLQHQEPNLQGNIYNSNVNQFRPAGPLTGRPQDNMYSSPNNGPYQGQNYASHHSNNDYARSVPINQGSTYQNQTVNPVANSATNSGLTPAALGNLMHDQRHDTPLSSQLQVVSRLDGKLIVHPDLSSDDIEVDNSLPFRHSGKPAQYPERKDKPNSQQSSKHDKGSDTSDSSSDDSDDELPKQKRRKHTPKHTQGKTVNISACKYVQLGHGNQIQNKSTTRKHEIKEKGDEITKSTVDKQKKDEGKSQAQPLRSSNIISESNILSGNNLSQDCISIEDNSIDQDLLGNNLTGHSLSKPSMHKIADISVALTQVNIASRPVQVKIDNTENILESDMHMDVANDPHGRIVENNLKYQQVMVNEIEREDSNENNETAVENFTDDKLFGDGQSEEIPTVNAGFMFSSMKDRPFASIMSTFQSPHQSYDKGTDEVD